MKPRVAESGSPPRPASFTNGSLGQSASPALKPPCTSSWASIYLGATANERERLLAQAYENRGVLEGEIAACARPPGRIPGVTSPLLSLLEKPDSITPEHTPAEARNPAQVGWFSPGLSRAAQVCVQRALASPDLFLLRGLPSPDLDEVVIEIIRQCVNQGQKVLLTGSHTPRVDRLLELLAASAECWPVRLTKAGVLPESAPENIQRYLPHQREAALVDAWNNAIQSRQAESRAFISACEAHLRAVPEWRDLCARWSKAQAEIEMARGQIAEAGDLRNEVEEGRFDQRAEWRRQREAEIARHAGSRTELQETVQKASLELTRAEEEWKKWQEGLNAQSRLVERRAFPNPFSLNWWRAFFQGRSNERLDEFRARVQDAEIQYLSARSQQQIVTENLEIEIRRHEAAIEQIIKNEVHRRQDEARRTLSERQAFVDATLAQWQSWLGPLEEDELCSSLPDLAVLSQLERRWQDGLVKEQAALTRDLQRSKEIERVRREAPDAVRQLANVVVLPAAECDCGGEIVEAWLRPGYERLIVLDADSFPPTVLHAIASWAKTAILIAEMPMEGASRPGVFDSLWNRLRPEVAEQSMRWRHDEPHWHCWWAGLTPELEAQLQREPLADQPEVDLFIVTPPGQAPRLAALAFPDARFTLETAKQFHATEMGEWALDPVGGEAHWSKRADCLCVEFLNEQVGEERRIVYADGVTETVVLLADPDAHGSGQASFWRTKSLEFSVQSGWTWSRLHDWSAHHWTGHDVVRSFDLTVFAWPSELRSLLRALRPETAPLLGAETPTQPNGALPCVQWMHAVVDSGLLAKSRQAGIRRLDSAKKLLPMERGLPTFDVSESKILVQAVDRLLRSQHGRDEARGDYRAPSVQFLARTETQRQMVMGAWKRLEKPRHTVHVAFGVLDELEGIQADIVAVSLWRGPVQSAEDPAFLLDLCTRLVLASGRCLLLVGDLQNFLHTESLEVAAGGGPGWAEACRRLRAFRERLQDSAPEPASLTAPRRTVA